MLDLNVEELKSQVEISRVQYLGGPNDGAKVVSILTNIEHLAKTCATWWIEKNAVHLYLLNKNDNGYYMMYTGTSVDKLLELTSEIYGKIPWDLVQAVPFLRSVEKGCKYYESSQ